MNSYYPGQAVTLLAHFSVDETPTDPSEVTLSVRAPDHEVSVYTLSSGEVVKTETGVFRRDVVVDQPGVWYFRYEGEGVTAAQEGAFEVLESRF